MKIYFEFDLYNPDTEKFLLSLLDSIQHHKGNTNDQETIQAESQQEVNFRDRNAHRHESGEAVPEQVEESGAEVVGKDAAFEALRGYIEANGGAAAKALLAEFGVGRFGELGEEHYGALVKRIGGGA